MFKLLPTCGFGSLLICGSVRPVVVGAVECRGITTYSTTSIITAALAAPILIHGPPDALVAFVEALLLDLAARQSLAGELLARLRVGGAHLGPLPRGRAVQVVDVSNTRLRLSTRASQCDGSSMRLRSLPPPPPPSLEVLLLILLVTPGVASLVAVELDVGPASRVSCCLNPVDSCARQSTGVVGEEVGWEFDDDAAAVSMGDAFESTDAL